MHRRRISTAERKHQDYLRRKGLKTSLAYERKLKALRGQEVRRVLEICKDRFSPDMWANVINAFIKEDYLLPWEQKLFMAVGVPMAKSTARDLSVSKAAEDEVFWEGALNRYAKERAGENIISVSGTLKDDLVSILQKQLLDDPTISVEKLAKNIYKGYSELAMWQVRRITQTETMIGMADAANVAAKTLDVGYTKIWAISGLGNTRETHYAMDGVEVDEDEYFELEGGLMLFPHDTSQDADASEIINCACACIRRAK